MIILIPDADLHLELSAGGCPSWILIAFRRSSRRGGLSQLERKGGGRLPTGIWELTSMMPPLWSPLCGSTLFCPFGHPRFTSSRRCFSGSSRDLSPGVFRKPIFGYTTRWFAHATPRAVYSVKGKCTTLVEHSKVITGAVLLSLFFFRMIRLQPGPIKFFNWIGTMWKGQLTFETLMLFSVGFMVTFCWADSPRVAGQPAR